MNGRWRSAAEICGHLKGRWNGRSGTCRCPAHEDRSPSLSVTQTRDGRVLVKCFAGCDQMTVIAALRLMGLWGDGEVTMDPSYPGYFTTRHDNTDGVDERKAREYARSIWDDAREAQGTPVEAYLRGRGIRLPVSGQLRYASRLKHSPSGKSFRAMIARISDERGFCGVQRTYLDANSDGKAPVSPNKMCKGPQGGGAVRLRMPSDRLGLAEGIETALSASQMYAMPVWATLSANRLGKIEIPKTVRILHIFGDSGAVGKREAFAAADEYERRGLHVEIVFPAAHFKNADNADFNSVLTEGARRSA